MQTDFKENVYSYLLLSLKRFDSAKTGNTRKCKCRDVKKKKCDCLLTVIQSAPNSFRTLTIRGEGEHIGCTCTAKMPKETVAKMEPIGMIEVQQMTAADHCPETVAVYPAVYKLCS